MIRLRNTREAYERIDELEGLLRHILRYAHPGRQTKRRIKEALATEDSA